MWYHKISTKCYRTQKRITYHYWGNQSGFAEGMACELESEQWLGFELEIREKEGISHRGNNEVGRGGEALGKECSLVRLSVVCVKVRHRK